MCIHNFDLIQKRKKLPQSSDGFYSQSSEFAKGSSPKITVCFTISPNSINTQERSDEIAGFLNHNTAQFWEYDTRIAFRWNIDPIERIGISGYNCFNGNPVFYNDINDDKAKYLDNGDKLFYRENENN